MPLPVLRLLALLLSAAALAGCSSAGQRMGAPPQPYELRLEEEFKAADLDGDEQLTPEEYRKGWPDVEVEFEALDSDGNGFLSLAEMKAYAQWRRIATWPERRLP